MHSQCISSASLTDGITAVVRHRIPGQDEAVYREIAADIIQVLFPRLITSGTSG